MGPHLTAVPGTGHEAVPEPGTAYTVSGPNTGRPADLGYFGHFPAEAHCVTCGMMIRRERYQRMSPGDDGEWKHTGRKPGEVG
jgi:hypothetical protein